MSSSGPILIAEGDPHFAGILAEVLQTEGFEAITRDRADSALAFLQGRSPVLAIIDIELADRSGLELAADLRRRFRVTQTPIILTSAIHRPDDPLIRRAIRDLEVGLFLAKPFSVLDFPSQVRGLVNSRRARHSAAAGGRADRVALSQQLSIPTDMVPDAESLRLVAQMWASRRDGVLRSRAEPDWATVKGGEPVDPGSLRLIARALYAPGASFHDMDNHVEGEPLELGPALWEAALRLAAPDTVMRALDQGLLLTGGGASALRLPLDLNTAVLLRALDPKRALGLKIRELDLEPQALAPSLAGLIALGLAYLNPLPKVPSAPRRSAARPPHRLPPTARRPGSRPPSRESSRDGPRRHRGPVSRARVELDAPSQERPAPRRRREVRIESAAPARPTMTPRAQERFLRKERARLESADDWTLLGVAANTDERLLAVAARRMSERYGGIRDDERATPAARALAEEIYTWIQEALVRIRAGHARKATAVIDRRTDEDIVFEHGLQAAAKEDWKRATQCFKAARNFKIDSARNLAWLGWSIYKDGGAVDFEEKAFELVALADSFDNEHPDGQYFLAVLESRRGSPIIAQRRLRRLLDHHPDRDDARRLLTELRLQEQQALPKAEPPAPEEGDG